MEGGSQRRARRIACRIPVRIGCGGRGSDGEAVDLSRTGVRILIGLEALTMEEPPTLLNLTRRLCDLLPTHTLVEFDPVRLGSLLARDVEIVRVGVAAGETPGLELGCRFREPLGAVDASVLGLEVPAGPDGEPAAPPPTDVRRRTRPARPGPKQPLPPGLLGPSVHRAADFGPELVGRDADAIAGPRARGVIEPRSRRRASRRYRARLRSEAARPARPVEAWTERLDAEGAELLVPDRARLPLPPDVGSDVSRLLVSLCEIYGTPVSLEIADGERALWSGPAEICAAEVLPRAMEALRLDLRFPEPLGAADRRRLGLA